MGTKFFSLEVTEHNLARLSFDRPRRSQQIERPKPMQNHPKKTS